MASFAIRVNVIYIASIEEKATVIYFLEHQLPKPPLHINIKLDIDFLLSLSLA